MGPFQWLATHWTPVIEYRDYHAIEVEGIAWGSTLIGSRRGFLVGFPAGALLILLIMGGVALSRLSPSDSAPAPRQGQPEAVASQAVSAELNSLREENRALKQQVTAAQAAARQGQRDAVASQAVSAELNSLREENRALKQQVMSVKAVATCPPCPPQALGKTQPQTQAVAAPPQPSKQATTRPAAVKKPVPDNQAAQPQAKAVSRATPALETGDDETRRETRR